MSGRLGSGATFPLSFALFAAGGPEAGLVAAWIDGVKLRGLAELRADQLCEPNHTLSAYHR